MKKYKFILLAFLLAGSLVWCQTVMAAGTPTTTVSSLMEVLKEDKQKAVYNTELNAPFSKDDSGVRESVSAETGEVTVINNVIDIPGRNGMDLTLNLEYRSRDAKTYSEGTKSASISNNYGQTVIVWYDVFDSSGYWLRTGGMSYPAGDTILGETTVDGENWVFTGQLEYSSGTSLFTSGSITSATVEKSRDAAAKYIFGEGWSLDMPSLDVDGENVYVNLPSGQTYKANFSAGIGLADYELTDIVFTKDSSYSNGAETSKYKLYYANGDSYYFSADGVLLAETDRFRNAIKYYYSTVNGLKLLTKVSDSIGRSVDIQYNDTVTIFKSGNKSVKLVKTPVPGVGGKYYLSTFIDAQGREFRYKYSFQEALFSQAGASAKNTYVNLSEILYPTGAKTRYNWGTGRKNIGSDGYMDYFKVTERKDVTGSKTYNLLKYQYHNEPDGYPIYKADNIDELYKYFTVVTDSKGLKTKYLYNSNHLPINVQQYTTRLLGETITQYHPKYKMPTKVTSKSYNTKGSVFQKVSLYEYDHRGNTIAENHPEHPSQTSSNERKTYTTYDYEYNLVTSKKFKQNKDITVEIKYTLSPDKKTVSSENIFGNGKLLSNAEYTYDGYGNKVREKVEKEQGQWVTSRFEYSNEYKGAYLTAVTAEGVKDADGFTRAIRTSSSYDFATGNQLTATDANGNATSFRYDALDRITQETNPDKSTRSYKYDDLQNILEAVNANGNRLVYHYDGLGNLTKVVDPVKNTVLVQMEYDENETLVSETDGNNNLKKLAYDQLVRITGVSRFDKAGKTLADTKVSYDEAYPDRFGKTFFKVSVTQKGDKHDRTNNYYFDSFDRLEKLGRINAGKEQFAYYKYDYLDKQIEAVDFAGQKATAQYDALGRLIKQTDAQGSSIRYNYDRLGNLISATDSLNQTIYYEYDSLGRKTVEKAPFEAGKYSITKFYYDDNGNLAKTVDPEGFVTRQHFNGRNFLTAVERIINSKKSNITKFEHDREGNTTKVIKGLNSFNDTDFAAYTYQYDNLNRLIAQTDALKHKTQYEYDDNGNLIKLTDRNKVETTYSYDGLNRLIEKRNSKDGNKNAVKITFDKLGNTRKMSDASGTTVFDYDDLGRLTLINYGNGIKQTYSYDTADRVSNLQVTQGSLNHINLKYGYDKVGRLTVVNDNGKRFNYKYNAIGQLIEELNGVTGVKSNYQYYPSGNVKSLRHFNSGKLLSGYEYKYDKRGNQIEKNEGAGTTKYYYDPLSRIKTALLPGDKVENYEYDDLDNIRELTQINGIKIEQTNYTYDKNSRLLLQETDKGSENTQRRFTYDQNGNQLTKDEVVKRNGSLVASKSFQYWYDGFNQLQRVQNPDGKFIEYTYDGNGMRTKKDFGDKAVNYYYNGGNIILETDKNNKATAKNIRGLRLIYRENKPGQTDAQFLYYLHNAHGDVTQLLNDKAEVVKDYRYGTYGQDEMPEMQVFGGKQSVELWRQEVEKIDNPFRYAGEYLDEETGNYYLRARYYDTSTQRFINEDSYGVERGAGWLEHLYGYGNNNPIKFIDPSGHDPFDLPNYLKKATSKISVKVKNTWIEGRRSGGVTVVPLRSIAYANGGTVSWDSKTKQAMITYNGKTRWFSSKNYYTENGQIWIKPETFNSIFGIKGTGQTVGQKIKQGAQNLLNENSPLGNWVEGLSGETLITGKKLTPEQRQQTFDKGTQLFTSGFIGMTGGIKTKGVSIQVTPDGVALPPGRTIPGELIDSPYRSGSYGSFNPQTGKFKESLRIDPATPQGKKGPSYSHYHLDGGSEHYSPKPGDFDPWPW